MKYSPELDGLRAIAAGLVVAAHAGVPGLNSGFLGVDVFFVLSGYLITRLLADEHGRNGCIDFKAFLIRRARRLYPPLLTLLAAYLICAPILWPDYGIGRHIQDALVAGLYMADYARTFGEPIEVLNHTWSLGVEEKYYLLWPLILTLIIRLPKHQGIAVIGLLFVVATLWRMQQVTTLDSYWLAYNRFDTHSSGLLLGSLLGYANARLPARWGAIGLMLLVAALALNGWKSYRTALFGFTEMEIATAILVCARPGFLGAGILPWLGKMSYGLYLWHYFFLRAALTQGVYGWPELLVISGGLGLGAAALSYYTVERLFRRNGNHYEARPRAARL